MLNVRPALALAVATAIGITVTPSARATEPALEAAFAPEALSSDGLSACGFVPNANKTLWTRTCASPIAEPWPWPDGPDHPVAVLTAPVTTYEAFAAGVYRLALTGSGALWFSVGGQPAQRCVPVGGQTICDLTLSGPLAIGLEVRKATASATVSVIRCAASTTACP